MDASDRNTTGLYTDSRQAPYDTVRTTRWQLLSKMTFNTTYTSNSAKETVVLDFVENFRAQYAQLFPTRAPLLLSPVNECLRPKFISTFVRPTLLPYAELYDYQACAAYVANYLTYDLLEDAEAFPHRLVSPTTTMAWQVGNCVEISIVLTSLLIGAGYNAYTVLGYASRAVVDNDQRSTGWPGKLPDEPFSEDEENTIDVTLNTRFAQFLKKRPALTSTFDELNAAKRGDADDGQDDGSAARRNLPAESESKRLCHAWVVLLPEKRGVKAPVFIEPSTGAEVSVDDLNYHGIEAIFNHQNYFVNMVPDAPPSRLNMDLYDLTSWEHVFLSDPQLATEDDAHDGDRQKAEDLTSDRGEQGDFMMDLPASWVDPITLNRSQYENRFPGRWKTIRYQNATVTYFADYSDPELRVMEVELPDDVMTHRTQRHTFFKHRHDLLRRESLYPSTERGSEWRKRHEWYLPGRKKESRVEGLREVIEEPGIRRTLRFYWRSREDGLASRTELFFNDKDPKPRKIIELYRGRTEDRLWYRSATYEQTKDGNGVGINLPGLAAPRDGTGEDKDKDRDPVKMAEKFRRNPAVPASSDVMKRAFIRPMQPDGEVWVQYHYGKDSITQSNRMYLRAADKDRELAGGSGVADNVPQTEVVTMPFEERPRAHTLREELKALIAAEKECLNEIKTKIEECREILSQRKTGGTEPMLSVYDTLRNRPQETEAERERLRREEHRRQESRKDYLAPYIAMLEVEKSLGGDYANVRLSAEHAKLVRDSALKDLKERLIQRGHIMQARMDKEKEELNRRQVAYQKNLDSSDHASKDSDEFAKFLTQATWRMKILDDRLSRHIEQASEKYAELAQKLANDARLAAIYEGK
jgi:hypothetical protein